MEKRFRFARFELDVHARELHKDRTTLRLQEQPFVVLETLLQHAGDVVTREELYRRLWPEGRYVDFEHGLNAAVSRLRSTLGDVATAPRFVETVPRRGFRFIARVDVAEIGQTIKVGAPQPTTVAGETVERSDRKPRLVVLPFSDLSTDSRLSWFAQGIADELIARLGCACAPRLGVVGLVLSSLSCRSAGGVRRIGETLQADYLLEGGIRLDGDRARVTIRLIETRGGTERWAESFDRPVSEGLAVEVEIAVSATTLLTEELFGKEAPASPRYPTASSDGSVSG